MDSCNTWFRKIRFRRLWAWIVCLPVMMALMGCDITQAREGTDSFLDACRLQAQAEQNRGNAVIRGKNGWLYLTTELLHMGKKRFWGPDSGSAGRAVNPEHRDPLPAILDFADQMKQAGIHLVLIPVPPKVVIYPEPWNPAFSAGEKSQRLDQYHIEFYDLLRTRGVDVLDLGDAFLREKTERADPLYCRTDTHWSGTGCMVAAREVARHIRSLGTREPVSEIPLSTRSARIDITGDLTRLAGGDEPEQETLLIRVVERSTGGGGAFLSPDSESPVLILADSHGLVFQAGGDMHAEGAGFFGQLSYELGYPTDLIAVRGSGATPARINLMRRIQKDPGYLSKKRVVVWCFSAREFTESDGWRAVPMVTSSGS